MNIPALIPTDTLPTLIDRATSALENARTSAEVLEARDLARVAYDAAKSTARMHRAKQAHDSLIADVHRAQANALAIRARAEMRLAEEYDAAQERGEVAGIGGNRGNQFASVDNANAATAADLGLRRDEIHEARKLRDAERDDPGLVARTIDGMIERGEEPTSAALRREVTSRPAPKRMNQSALWLWGRIKDFERMGVLSENPDFLVDEMTEPMRADMRQMVPAVRAFLEQMEQSL